jgi:hypothetical protein
MTTPKTEPKTESDLRRAVIDRLIAARLNESKPAKEAMLEQCRTGSLAAVPPLNTAQDEATITSRIRRWPAFRHVIGIFAQIGRR